MTKEERQEAREALLKEQEKLYRKIATLKELTRPVAPDVSIGRISRMDAINNKSVNEAALRTAEEKIKNIEHSLAHVEDENFGKCRRCGNDIHLRRLVFMPGSSLCISCASRR